MTVMKLLRQLVTDANIYISKTTPNVRLLVSIATYITDVLKVFGVIPGDSSIGFPLDSQSDGKTQVR